MTTVMTATCCHLEDVTSGLPDPCFKSATYRLDFGSVAFLLCDAHTWECIAFNADQCGPGVGARVHVEPASS